ncbi:MULTISPECIES: winged helix-turn-helix domain-containing protein [Microvirga]|uniref:Response regulator with CheY-like receiver domain and winged-helix DNA-binding domain n=1 Tax=Microvirga lotononidis TaxID=864069 RepID=I4YX57_9HYPH|nr:MULTISPECIES: response regulator transcription factor [Microvirga]EIM28549.1 response regulator with CheY-like receiver domain and winged-helix DNA-binding domain [Microvirga lotononidis]WQO30203.1 response regulator transcription factor [Microvirga lotononidis]
MRTLLVDHHTNFARTVRGALAESGFAVDIACTLEEASSIFHCASYEILLLELALPDGNGLDWLRQLRSGGHSVPAVIMSCLDDCEKRIASFNGGADDFLLKPVSPVELIARMRAIQRRARQMAAPILVFGNLNFDPISREVSVAGDPLTIARRELCILEHLLSRAGRVVPRDQLEDHLYPFNDEVSTNALEVGIYRLRGHLNRSGATPRIKTVRGIGYILQLPDAASV